MPNYDCLLNYQVVVYDFGAWILEHGLGNSSKSFKKQQFYAIFMCEGIPYPPDVYVMPLQLKSLNNAYVGVYRCVLLVSSPQQVAINYCLKLFST